MDESALGIAFGFRRGLALISAFGLRHLALIAALAAEACGGSSSPTSPTSAPSLEPTSACGTIGGVTTGATTSIVNGAECRPGTSAVVLINLRDRIGNAVGSCSGTIIAPRVVLTGAHCLDEDVALARVWLGSGPEMVAESFVPFPNYRQGDSSTPDVGIVRMARDLGPAPVPLLTGRDARVGETAVIAGWGRDQASVPSTLRAGTAVLSAVGPLYLETQFSATASSICSGDSGGPILLSEGNAWSVGGVISAASVAGCTTGTNFYVSIRNPAVLSFIRGAMGSESTFR